LSACAFVDVDVVVAASELEVVEVGVAAGPPGGAVVGVAPFGWGVAAGFDAPPNVGDTCRERRSYMRNASASAAVLSAMQRQ